MSTILRVHFAVRRKGCTENCAVPRAAARHGSQRDESGLCHPRSTARAGYLIILRLTSTISILARAALLRETLEETLTVM
jgi:hypothetical protein